MKTFLTLLLVLLLGGAILIEHPGGTPTIRSDAGTVTRATVPGDARVDPVRPTPCQQEIRAVVDSARAAEAGLMEELGTDGSPDHPIIQRHRRTVTLRLLELQARHAAAQGRYGLERRIRANLALLRAEGPTMGPAEGTLARRGD